VTVITLKLRFDYFVFWRFFFSRLLVHVCIPNSIWYPTYHPILILNVLWSSQNVEIIAIISFTVSFGFLSRANNLRLYSIYGNDTYSFPPRAYNLRIYSSGNDSNAICIDIFRPTIYRSTYTWRTLGLGIDIEGNPFYFSSNIVRNIMYNYE